MIHLTIIPHIKVASGLGTEVEFVRPLELLDCESRIVFTFQVSLCLVHGWRNVAQGLLVIWNC